MRVCMCVFLGQKQDMGGCAPDGINWSFQKVLSFITFYLLLRQLKANQNIVPTLHPLQETNWASTLLICVCTSTPNSLPTSKSFNCFWTCQMEGFEVLALVSPEVALVRAFACALSCSPLFCSGVVMGAFFFPMNPFICVIQNSTLGKKYLRKFK